MRNKPLTTKSFLAMNSAQKEAIYDACERVSPLRPGRPLSAAERNLHCRGKRKAGRPRVGEGAAKIRISLERELLRRADRWAASRDLNRSEVIATALRSLLKNAA